MFQEQKGSFLPILGILILLLTVGGCAYYLGTQKKPLQSIDNSSTLNNQSTIPPHQTTKITINSQATPTSQPKFEPKVYKADKDICGEIVSNKKTADNYKAAFKILEKEKKEQFTKSCPENPCQEVELESTKAHEVTDVKDHISSVNLYLIKVKDKSTGFLAHSMSEAIDDEGILYDINWCKD